MLHTETVAPSTLSLLKSLQNDDFLADFVLVGGTSLSLQIGHRVSIDLDLFAQGDFKMEELSFHLEEAFGFSAYNMSNSILQGYIDGVKTDFVRYPYKTIRDIIRTDGIRLISSADIAAMKLSAIMMSGKRLKDFVDISFLSQYYSTFEMLGFFAEKFPKSSPISAEKSLIYFKDIDFDVEIKLFEKDFKWIPVKNRLLEMSRYPHRVFDSAPL